MSYQDEHETLSPGVDDEPTTGMHHAIPPAPVPFNPRGPGVPVYIGELFVRLDGIAATLGLLVEERRAQGQRLTQLELREEARDRRIAALEEWRRTTEAAQ